MHFKSDEIPLEEVAPGLKRQILGYNSHIMCVKVFFDKGAVGEPHEHPHHQATYVATGKFEVKIGEKTELLSSGDCFIVPSNTRHGVVCMEQGILLDTFSPIREDFL